MTISLIQRKMNLLQETEIAIHAIEVGFGHFEKNRLYAPKPYHFIWMILFSTGFERLMKVVICMHELEHTGTFPSKAAMQNIGHNLIELRNGIINRCFTAEYLAKTFAKKDYDFITSDNALTGILDILNDFAKKDRYMFMDRITADSDGRETPKIRWEYIERLVMGDTLFYQMAMQGDQLLQQQANVAIKACIERFVRALTRLFLHANLGDLARSQYATISRFATMQDEELGNSIYEL